jgi:secreted Zn-dependent insulinase-like peptidase
LFEFIARVFFYEENHALSAVVTDYNDLYLQIFDIIGFVYQYLKLLREVPPQQWIFKELQDIGNMEFRFAEEQPQDDYAAELAGLSLLSLACIFLFVVCTTGTSSSTCNL